MKRNIIKNKKSNQTGLIQIIILIIIAVAILSWFKVDIENFFTSDLMKKNLGFIWNFVKDVWSTYLAGPVSKLWGLWIEYAWNPFLEMLKSKAE